MKNKIDIINTLDYFTHNVIWNSSNIVDFNNKVLEWPTNNMSTVETLQWLLITWQAKTWYLRK